MHPAPVAPVTSRSAPAPLDGDGPGRATRFFGGPGAFPPEDFAAWAVVAFPAWPRLDTLDRFLMFCRAYTAVIPVPAEVDVPRDRQLATLWPVRSDALAGEARALGRSFEAPPCDIAAGGYDGRRGDEAIRMARASGERLSTRARGPFLFAWAPPEARGRPDVPFLMLDLSRVSTPAEARAQWAFRIERAPQLWLRDGFDIARLRRVLVWWANDLGSTLHLVGSR